MTSCNPRLSYLDSGRILRQPTLCLYQLDMFSFSSKFAREANKNRENEDKGSLAKRGFLTAPAFEALTSSWSVIVFARGTTLPQAVQKARYSILTDSGEVETN
eukprot:5021275-Amphidinium_carterae.1